MNIRRAVILALVAIYVGLAVFVQLRADVRSDIKTLPRSRGGQYLIGKPMPQLQFTRWLNTEGNKPVDTANSVTLYRWWTNGCPFCESTLPGIEKLRKEYQAKGLKVVGVYHPKPPRPISDEIVKGFAAKLGYGGAVAVDQDWSQLKAIWLSTGKRDATSVSFLVDKNGVIRFVHPGTEYFPSVKREDAQQNEDYRLIVDAIEALLKE